MSDAFTSYRFNDAAQTAYEFFWNDFCDWYVEATKLSFRSGSDAEKDRAATVLLSVLEESLRLLHPLIPFVTEEIYGKLPVSTGPLATARFPEPTDTRRDAALEADFLSLQDLIRQVRTLRSECLITPEKKLRVEVRTEAGFASADFFKKNAPLFELLAGVGALEFAPASGDRPPLSIGLVGKGWEAFVFIREAVDAAQLAAKFAKDLEKDTKFLAALEAKLANENFVKNAPPELVAAEREKTEDVKRRIAKLGAYVRDLA
jgi:valyl-tRNA synthetase